MEQKEIHLYHHYDDQSCIKKGCGCLTWFFIVMVVIVFIFYFLGRV